MTVLEDAKREREREREMENSLKRHDRQGSSVRLRYFLEMGPLIFRQAKLNRFTPQMFSSFKFV